MRLGRVWCVAVACAASQSGGVGRERKHRRTTQGSAPDVNKAIIDRFEQGWPCAGWQWFGRYRFACVACAPVAVAAEGCVCVSPVAPSLL